MRNPAVADPPRETNYQLVLPHSRVSLTYTVPRAAADTISLQLENPDGVAVDTWAMEEPDWGDPENPRERDEVDPEGDWDLLYGLFEVVHRRVTGWDEVVNDIEQALAGPGPIGLLAPAKRFADASATSVGASMGFAVTGGRS